VPVGEVGGEVLELEVTGNTKSGSMDCGEDKDRRLRERTVD
jgi:hypothetical protein